MIPNLDFIKTALNGIVAFVEKAIKNVEAKIVTPDFEAKEDEAGYIKNKPVVPVHPGTGEGSVAFGDGRASGFNSFAHGCDNAYREMVRAIGIGSHAEGTGTSAEGYASHAEGKDTHATGGDSHSEGLATNAKGAHSHAEGDGTTASGNGSHAEGWGAKAEGYCSHAEGHHTWAYGEGSHAEGLDTSAEGKYSHSEGGYTTAQGEYQHVQGKYNVIDTENKYAHIVGNGKYESSTIVRSNAYTLDWQGNAWYAGSIEGTALILKSSTEGSTKRFKITVNDSGTLSATEITT